MEERTKTSVRWGVMDILPHPLIIGCGFVTILIKNGGGLWGRRWEAVRIKLGKRHEVSRLAGSKPSQSGNEGMILPPPFIVALNLSHVTRVFTTRLMRYCVCCSR